MNVCNVWGTSLLDCGGALSLGAAVSSRRNEADRIRFQEMTAVDEIAGGSDGDTVSQWIDPRFLQKEISERHV